MSEKPVCSVILVNGWSYPRDVLLPLSNALLSALPDCQSVEIIDPIDHASLDSIYAALDQTVDRLPAPICLAGWSLGGNIATSWFVRHAQPSRHRGICGLVLLQSNPCFVQLGDWPNAMSDVDFSMFYEQTMKHGADFLPRFDALAVLGSRHRRGQSAFLKQIRQNQFPELTNHTSTERLHAGLDLLRQLDTRIDLEKVAVPVLHILGAEDRLVPVSVAPALTNLGARHVVDVQDGIAHLIADEDLPDIAKRIGHWWASIDQENLLIDQEELLIGQAELLIDKDSQSIMQGDGIAEINKQAIAQSFGRAAETYDQVAHLQRKIGEQALQLLSRHINVRQPVGLDLGCGTGFFTPRLFNDSFAESVIGLDLAEGMLRYARVNRAHSNITWCAGDAECLPLANASVDVMFSSLAIQWCANPQQLFDEIARVLRPGGVFVFATLVDGTLCELKSAWQEADAFQHVNQFLQPADLVQAVQNTDLSVLTMDVENEVPRYRHVKDLTQELKQLGAHNLNHGRSRAVTGRERIRRFRAAYERFRDADGLLPATYCVLYGVVAKPR